MGKKQRVKGHSYERKVANKYKAVGYKKARRHLEYQDGEAEKGVDIHGVKPFAVQCKAWKSYPPVSKIEEVNPEDTEYAVLHMKGDYKNPVVVLYEKDWMEIVKMLKANVL